MSGTYPADLQAFIQQELDSGHYQSEDELVAAALKVYRELRARHQQLCDDVLDSIAQADRGEAGPLDIDEVVARGRQRLAAKGIED